MSSEDSLKSCKQALLPVAGMCTHSNTHPRACSQCRNPLKVSEHAALPNPGHPLPSLWAGGSPLLYLSDTHFAQGAEVNGLVTEQRSNDIFSVPKKFLMELSSLQHMGLKSLNPGKIFFPLPITSQPSVSNSKSQDTHLNAMNLVRLPGSTGRKDLVLPASKFAGRHTAVDVVMWNYLTFSRKSRGFAVVGRGSRVWQLFIFLGPEASVTQHGHLSTSEWECFDKMLMGCDSSVSLDLSGPCGKGFKCKWIHF